MIQKGWHYLQLMRFDRPIGTFLLLWPVLTALWIANNGKPSFALFIIFVSGVVVMRAAGCVINDYIDRDFDKHVKRTCHRPLANGALSPREALIIFVLLCCAGLILLLFLNAYSRWIGVCSLLMAIIYPFSKRFTYLPQLVLGITWSGGILMAFSASQNYLPVMAGLLFAANVILTLCYDTMYGMVDRDDDIKIGIKSTAILFGETDRLVIGLLQVLLFLLWLGIGIYGHFNFKYFMAIVFAGILLLYQQYLIKDREPQHCLKAFLNNHLLTMIIFVGVLFTTAS